MKKTITPPRLGFRRSGLGHTLGMKLVSLAKGRVTGRMPWTKQASQWNGLIHGGALAALADTAAGVGTLYFAGPEKVILTTEMKINFFGNKARGSVDAEGRILYRGKKSMVWEIRITETGKHKLLAFATVSYIMIDKNKGGAS